MILDNKKIDKILWETIRRNISTYNIRGMPGVRIYSGILNQVNGSLTDPIYSKIVDKLRSYEF